MPTMSEGCEKTQQLGTTDFPSNHGRALHQVAIDVVGPLTRTKAGNKYILTLMDYGSRCQEATPMKNTDSQTVATALVDIFSRLGIPEEILSDQWANFISKLMRDLYKLLGVKPIRTSPYHTQTNGAVKRFHGTFKTMLKKYEQDQRGWDTLLPYLLFTYRGVQNRSTVFLPFDHVWAACEGCPRCVEEWLDRQGCFTNYNT